MITFFNRESNSIRTNKLKIAYFLDKQKIDRNLRGRIIAEYEQRILKTKKTDRTQFINDISSKLAKNYGEAKFKHQANKFMPRFIRRANLSIQGFNEII